MTEQESGISGSHVLSPNEILDVIDAIPESMCGRLEAGFLLGLSSNTRIGGAIVEIGTCAGKSTIALTYGQQTFGGVPVNTIDIREHPKIDENLNRAHVHAFVNRIVKPSRDAAAGWHEQIKLLWIDGDHTFAGVSADIDCWSGFVMPGGLLAFHDFPSPGGKALGGVGRAVYRKVLSRPDRWRVVADRQAGSIIVFERLADLPHKEAGYSPTPWEAGKHFVGKLARRVARKAARIRARFERDGAKSGA